MTSKRILFIEDDRDTQSLFKEIFLMENYDIDVFDDATGALEHLKTNQYPDIVLMDLHFPEMSPSEFMKKFRSGSEGKDVPLVIISGDSEIRQAAEDLGANGFLRKPVDLYEALDIVSQNVKH